MIAALMVTCVKAEELPSSDKNIPATSDEVNSSESALWAEVQKGDTVDDYQVYLDQYAKGKYVALAKSRIKELQEQAAAELAKNEQNAWDSATSAATEEGYQNYLNTYPKGIYAALAKSRIKKLQQQAAAELAQNEQSAWDGATSAATEDSYQDYLNLYPKGRYSALAESRIKKLHAEEAR